MLVLAETEARWQASYDSDRLRAEVLSVDLWAGLEPYPEGWRARVRKPETLPHFPMVLHRGGYPDGS